MKTFLSGSRHFQSRPVLLAGWLAVLTCGWLLPARGQVIISEFMAANHNGLVDENGDTSDWIEIYNGATNAVDLAGWHLTDNAADLTKWTFPSTSLGANCFVLVWASGKDRAVAGTPLHTSFNLSSAGEYLALVNPDGTVASEFAPAYPQQYDDVSYGVVQQTTATTLLSTNALARVLVPANGSLGTNWTLPAFDDSAWRAGTNGVGYQNSVPGFAVKLYKAAAGVTIGSLAAADALISTPSQQAAVFSENRNVVNDLNTSANGHYASDYPIPGYSTDTDDYVIEATGWITIPMAGDWSFGVNSDDGFRLTVGSFTTLFDGGRGASDTIATFNFATAGEYPIRLVMFERAGGSSVETFAIQGAVTTWNANFHLVGDTASGGLAVRSMALGSVGFGALIKTDVQASMTNQNATAYIRLPFVVTNTASFQTLTLLMKYDDGFVAYLNGVEVARRNAPTTPAWNSNATATRNSAQVLLDESIDLTLALGQLVVGTNVLAIQGLNDSASGDDFLIVAQLQEFRTVNSSNQYFASSTPGTFNTTQPYYFKVGDTKFSQDRGFYETNFTVAITCLTTGAVIRCTLDGSVPTLANGFTYTNAIPVTNTTTLRAGAFLSGYTPSDVDTHTYIFIRDVLQQREAVVPGPGWPQTNATSGTQIIDYGLDIAVVTNAAYSGEISNDLRSIPSFSLVMDLGALFNTTTGIYVNPNGDTGLWERPCSLELINPDGTKGFQANCGARIRGGYSRSTDNPKHAFRFFFRSDYGVGQLNYPICGTTNGATQTFQKFDLRTFQNYSWSYGGDSKFTGLRDQSNRDTQLALGSPSSHGQYYYLFINGQFWGLYNIDERPEANFGESYFGGTAEQYDTIKTAPDASSYSVYATDGTIDAWFRLWQQATNGFADLAAYLKVQGFNADGTRNSAYENLLDVDNLIDYMLVHLYGNDIDAPISNFLNNESPNNIFCLRNTNNTAGFRFITHDAEHTYLLYNVGIDRFGPFPAGDPFALNSDGVTYNGFAKSSPGYLWKQMTASAEFRMRLADRVQKACFNGGPMTVEATLARFAARTNEIFRAIPLESARWGNAKRTPSYTRADWLAAVSDFASYIRQRTDLLMAQFRAKGLFPTVLAPNLSQYSGSVVPGYSLAVTNPNGAGQVYYTLDGSDPRLLGGSLASTALAYSTNLTLSTHTFLRARVKSGADWSPIIEANLYVTQDFSKLIVSEIMYNPADGDSYEFLELKNVGDRTLDLSGLYFSSGLTFTFTNGTLLAPGHFFVLGRNVANFTSRYPGVALNGLYTGKLNNSGDTLKLTHPLGGTVLSVTYNDSAPWPAAPDGFGFSLVPVNPNAPFNLDTAANWRASTVLYGSPGADDPAPAIAPILVNEILSSSALPQVDTVELFNPTSAGVDVGGWFLTDDKNTPMKYRIPIPTVIPAGGYVTFDESQFNVVPGVEPSFSFSSHGEQVYLFSGASGPVATLTGYSHGFAFAGASPGVSFGRYVNSVGDEQFPAQSALTLGTNNAGPLVGPVVINEVMYHPLAGANSFVELMNITASAVPLYDPANPTNTWRLNGLGFSFPAGAQIAANGYVIVADTDPAVFRSLYTVPLAVPIFGPYSGTLQNSGEALELQMPGVPDTNGVPMITVDAVRYNDKAPWPVSADGDGPSLQRHLATAYGNDPTNWFASGTTPGGDNLYNAAPTIMLNTPTNGAAFNVPVNILLQATASDSDGTITKVEFFQNNVKIGESTTSPFSFTWINVPAGSYTLTARAIDNGFATAMSSNVQITVIPPPLGTGIGLKGDYYDNMDYTGYLFSTTNGTINFDWGTGSPSPSVGVDTFTIRWTGMVQPRFSDTYTFYTTSDDGVRLWVNGQLLIDKWVNQSPTEWSASIALLAGQYYTIQMDYYENGGGAVAKLSWASANVSKEIIPQTQLYPFLLPAIVTQPTARTVGQGTATTFTVVATNSPTGYQWLFNAAPIAGATNVTFTLTNVQPTNAGSYSVIVANAAGSVLSLTATLTVIPPPVITSQPQSLGVMAGSNATFSVGASGTPPLAYQWRLNSTNLAGATNFFLSLTNVQYMHVGLYSVAVSNLGGVVVSSNSDLAVA